MNKRELLKVLESEGITSVKKRLGQNFIIDKNLTKFITDKLLVKNENKNNLILEIGPGLGALTDNLIKSKDTNNIVSIEYDNKFFNFLKKKYSNFNNIKFINNDILNVDISKIVENCNYVVISSLPYYLATPIISKLLNYEKLPETMVLLVQEEIANRLISKPNCKDYGKISVKLQLLFSIKKIKKIPPDVFYPKPLVQSSIIICNKKNNISISEKEKNTLGNLLNILFSNRRKKITTSIKKFLDANTSANINKNYESILNLCNIEQNFRPENITPEKYLKLVKSINNSYV